MSSTAELLNRLRIFVQAEAERQYDSLSQQWSRALAVRVAKGWAIEGLSDTNIDKDFIELHW